MITPIVMRDFLYYYGYDMATESGCRTIYNTWMINKAKLLEKFRKHPNWDEENLAIVFKDDEYERGFDVEAFEPFIQWAMEQGAKLEYDDTENHVFTALNYIKLNCHSQFISKEQADKINELCPKVKVSEGLKLTKAIQRICKVAGFDTIKDVRKAHEGTDRLKDFGFNYHFMALADRINPVKYKRITVISLNPLDYWSMSFGYKWASCHTIDKNHIRKNNDSNHHYNGCYSAGTESYMLDSSSIIFYVISEDYEGNVYYNEDKMNRVVFCVNDDASMILESRVYPDGRDGGDSSLAGQFRNVMQKVICDTYDINNYWTVKKGTGECSKYTHSEGPHYKDYLNYNDCNVSINKDECMSFPKIRIGHDAICPGCGDTHYGEANIMCYDCGGEENDDDIVFCEQCGARINADRDDYEYLCDRYFCDCDCARSFGLERCEDNDEWYWRDELYFCEDDECYHNVDNSYKDDYDDCYYSGQPYLDIKGYYYSCEENAKEDGWALEYFSDKWERADELDYDEYENVYFDPSNIDCIVTLDERCFPTEASAEHAGYVETQSLDWILKTEAIEIDGMFYIDEDDAEDNGYVKNEDGIWVACEVAV